VTGLPERRKETAQRYPAVPTHRQRQAQPCLRPRQSSVNQEIGDATAESGFCFLRSVAYTGGMGSKPAVPVLQPAPRNLMFPPVMGRQTGSTGILAVRWKLHCTKSGMMHYLRAV